MGPAATPASRNRGSAKVRRVQPPFVPAYHRVHAPETTTPRRWLWFLHGILGSGANWRSFAREFVQRHPSWGAVLVDLRKHGGSQDAPAPHTLFTAADDLRALQAVSGTGPRVVLGHSFGGKVALAFAGGGVDGLRETVVLDATPSARPDARGSETTRQVIELLGALPPVFATRDAFVGRVTAAGLDLAIAQWLGMNLRPREHGPGYVLRVDQPAIHAMLRSYLDTDLWPVLERPDGTTRFTVVAGSRSPALDAADRVRLEALAHPSDGSPSRVRFEVVADAGHWVHVDAPAAVHALLDRVAASVD